MAQTKNQPKQPKGKSMSEQIQFGSWEHLPVGSAQRNKMEKEYVAQHHQGGGSISDFLGSLPGSLGHTLTHPGSSGVHGLPGYGLPLSLLAGVGAGAGLGALGAAGEGAAEGGTAARALAGSKLAKVGVPLAAAGVASHLLSKGGSPQVDPSKPQTAADPAAATQSSPPISPSTMPLFMQSIMEPYLNSIMKQIQGTAQGYGNYMNQLTGSGPGSVALNPAIRQALQAMVPGQQATMNLMGESGAGSVVAGGALDQLSQQIQQAASAQRTAQGEYEKQLGAYAMIPPSVLSGTGATLNPAGPTSLGAGGTTPLSQQILAKQYGISQVANAGG